MLRALVLTAIALHAIAGIATAQDSTAVAVEEVLVLPFANYSGKYEAYESVLPVFYHKVDSLGLRVMTHEDLRPILRQNRIRVVGQVGMAAMEVLRAETGSRYAIVGSIDIFEPGRSMEVMISARLVDLKAHLVVTAVSVGKTVQETEGAFGLGRAQAIEAVIDQVVVTFMEHMEGPMAGESPVRREYHKCGLVAIIPLEDYSQRRHGAEVLQNLLMSELVARDWRVVEPGIVREFLLDARQMARGGVSNAVLRTLRDRIGTCYAVTGDLEVFSIAPSGVDAAVPKLDFGLRLINARTGTLVASIDRTRSGMQGEKFFARGREYSMVRLARSSMAGVVTWIAEEGDQ